MFRLTQLFPSTQDQGNSDSLIDYLRDQLTPEQEQMEDMEGEEESPWGECPYSDDEDEDEEEEV